MFAVKQCVLVAGEVVSLARIGDQDLTWLQPFLHVRIAHGHQAGTLDVDLLPHSQDEDRLSGQLALRLLEVRDVCVFYLSRVRFSDSRGCRPKSGGTAKGAPGELQFSYAP